jgi:hypothetical protein
MVTPDKTVYKKISTKLVLITILAVLVAWLLSIFLAPPATVRLPIQPAPYPPGEYEISFDQSSMIKLAPGSDNWAVTWADDNHQYAPWGDGGGFGGTNGKGRVSLGIGRIEGGANNYQGFNVWGGFNPEHSADIDGKSYGLLAIDGMFYMWVSPSSGIDSFKEARLYTSSNRAETWTPLNWAFTDNEAIISPTFLQFGKNYEGARDNFVYIYAPRLKDATALTIQKPGQIDLIRVPQQHITDRSQYQFFAGTDEKGKPQWTQTFDQRLSAFEDINGVGWSVSVSYNPGLERYFLATEHSESMVGNIGIYDAPEPWGPWTAVAHEADLAGAGTTFFWNFSNKWLSKDGKDFVLIFTGVKESDAWGTIQGRFHKRQP